MKKSLIKKVILTALSVNVLAPITNVAAQDLNPMFPLAEEATFDVFVGKGPQNAQIDWNQGIWVWDQIQGLTNVKMNWNQIPGESVTEQRNLSLVSGDIPDIYYSAGFPTADIFKYGQQGIFLPLNDLIKEYAPNLNKLIEENPTIAQGITFPDGNIYGLPRIFEKDFLSLRIGPFAWVQKGLVESNGLTLPEKTDELVTFLKAIKEANPDVIPMGAPGISYILDFLSGSFNVQRSGNVNGPIQVNDEGKIEFFGTSDEYKAMLEYIHELYAQELIDPSIFNIEWSQFVSNKNEKMYGVSFFWGPSIGDSAEYEKDNTALTPLEGPGGHRSFNALSSEIATNANFIITSEAEHPEIAVAWLDYLYSPEGAHLFYLGKEGETYEVVDGNPVYLKEVNDAVANYFSWLGNGQGIVMEDYFIGSENSNASRTAADQYEPYVNYDVMPRLTYTAEENDFLLAEGVDIEKYFEEMRDGFISGEVSFDRWGEFVDTLNNIGLERYVQIKQSAYDRMTQE